MAALLAVGAAASLLLWPDDDEVDARATSTASRSVGPTTPRVVLESTSDVAPDDASTDLPTTPAEGAAQRSEAEAAGASEVGVGRLTGRVAGPGGEVVAGAVVVVRLRGRGEPLRLEVDGLGRFDAVVPAAVYSVFAQAPGHVAGPYARADVPKDGVADVGSVPLRRARSTLTGRVLGPTGAPLADASVSAAGNARGEEGQAVTAPDGTFAIGGLPEGVYRVRAHKAGHRRSAEQAVAVTEARGGEATITLEVGGRVAGTVTDSRGGAAASASVFAYRQDERLSTVKADADGRFEVDGLPPGPIELLLRSDDGRHCGRAAVEVVAGGLVVRDVALTSGNQLTGRLTDPQGAPVVGVHVIAQALGDDVKRTGYSDADGRYSLEQLYPGRYRLGVAWGGPRGASEPARHLAEVDLVGGAAVHDLVVPAGSALAGEVVREDGRPLANAVVHAFAAGDYRGSARTDEEGHFRLVRLPSGRCQLFVREAQRGLIGQLEQDVPQDALVEGLRLLARSPATVRGRVLDPAGRPVPDLDLVLRGHDAPVERSARTDADGRFVLSPLYDGEYELEAEPGPLLMLARRLDSERATLPGQRLVIAQSRDVACELRVALE